MKREHGFFFWFCLFFSSGSRKQSENKWTNRKWKKNLLSLDVDQLFLINIWKLGWNSTVCSAPKTHLDLLDIIRQGTLNMADEAVHTCRQVTGGFGTGGGGVCMLTFKHFCWAQDQECSTNYWLMRIRTHYWTLRVNQESRTKSSLGAKSCEIWTRFLDWSYNMPLTKQDLVQLCSEGFRSAFLVQSVTALWNLWSVKDQDYTCCTRIQRGRRKLPQYQSQRWILNLTSRAGLSLWISCALNSGVEDHTSILIRTGPQHWYKKGRKKRQSGPRGAFWFEVGLFDQQQEAPASSPR